ncbi:hypothetical protein B0W47_14160 [Komagataeibacter nataicola]|uniref:Uncharacterized protein n=1 Tax=Komagataeibacter nataicola TaxID=265960 RepID=A0A9N7H300_9PROT|nr:DUF3311 domain-containing protein [Komagataeibacter nataicola]AQU88410.1 hypothetical protein B0W47_14160 [Komagataeibacter nataicola]PYD65215.1 hypothetical protein CDI09_14850 [Komagataeibacter nataicola]WEQ54492.1 DUF3311 domain-containing protein [Komagataeibacter nataicola]
MRDSIRVLTALGIPFAAVVLSVPLLARSSVMIMGFPIAVAWLFFCLFLTSASMGIVWFVADRKRDDG